MLLPINSQPIEKLDNTAAPGTLQIVEIWPTIQGEGPFAGLPAVFIRLAGCNLQCRYCDTNYTDGRRTELVESIYNYALSIMPGVMDEKSAKLGLFVITGGEPFRQNISPLVNLICKEGGTAQIETNGTLPVPHDMDDRAVIICSPKTGSVHFTVELRADYWKYVITDGKVSDLGFPTEVLGMPMNVYMPTWENEPKNIYIQPCDEYDASKNQKNIKQAVDVCLKFGYRLCLQVHKYAGMR